MELINKLDAKIADWAKSVPHLPAAGQKWLGMNIWWIILIGAILSGIGVIVSIVAIFGYIALFGSFAAAYYTSTSYITLAIVGVVVSLIFIIVRGLLLAMAVTPLKVLQKKGWVLLFVAWLVQAVNVVIGSIVSFSIIGFLFGIIGGAIGLLISGYFLYEIRGQFAQVTKKAKKA